MSQLAASCHRPATLPGAEHRLLLIGNPNVGKSLLFGCLTNRYVTVSNYPGTTVEITSARATIAGESRLVIDTPGTNGLVPQSDDERVARDILLSSPGADVMQVGDMSNIRRTLLLSLQIAEHEMPFTLCLNMSDEAKQRDAEVDPVALAAAIGIPVVATSALRRWNLERLKREAIRPARSPITAEYPAAIEEAIAEILEVLDSSPDLATRGIALSILSGDETLKRFLPEESLDEFDAIRERAQARVNQPLSWTIVNARLNAVDRILGNAAVVQSLPRSSFREWFGAMTMHPVWGWPFLLGVLYVAWLFVGKFGAGIVVNFVENTIFQQHVNVWTIKLIDFVARFPHQHTAVGGVIGAAYAGAAHLSTAQQFARFFHDLLVGPYGVVTMALTYAIAIVLPVVITFFIVLRRARGLRAICRDWRSCSIGCSGGWASTGRQSFRWCSGLGCDTMATLTTRILETKKEW